MYMVSASWTGSSHFLAHANSGLAPLTGVFEGYGIPLPTIKMMYTMHMYIGNYINLRTTL